MKYWKSSDPATYALVFEASCRKCRHFLVICSGALWVSVRSLVVIVRRQVEEIKSDSMLILKRQITIFRPLWRVDKGVLVPSVVGLDVLARARSCGYQVTSCLHPAPLAISVNLHREKQQFLVHLKTGSSCFGQKETPIIN